MAKWTLIYTCEYIDYVSTVSAFIELFRIARWIRARAPLLPHEVDMEKV